MDGPTSALVLPRVAEDTVTTSLPKDAAEPAPELRGVFGATDVTHPGVHLKKLLLNGDEPLTMPFKESHLVSLRRFHVHRSQLPKTHSIYHLVNFPTEIT